jgi:hypothetical protein
VLYGIFAHSFINAGQFFDVRSSQWHIYMVPGPWTLAGEPRTIVRRLKSDERVEGVAANHSWIEVVRHKTYLPEGLVCLLYSDLSLSYVSLSYMTLP